MIQMNFNQNLSVGFSDFCKDTSIHGLRNIGNPNKSNLSRFIWLIVEISCFVGAGYIIYQTVQGKPTPIEDVIIETLSSESSWDHQGYLQSIVF